MWKIFKHAQQKVSKSLEECPKIIEFVAASNAKAFNDAEL